MLMHGIADARGHALRLASPKLPDLSQSHTECRLGCSHQLPETMTGGQNRVLPSDRHAALVIGFAHPDSREHHVESLLRSLAVNGGQRIPPTVPDDLRRQGRGSCVPRYYSSAVLKRAAAGTCWRHVDFLVQ